MKEEDKLLLSSLGVVSANPDDIERHLLAKAENKVQEKDIGQPSDQTSSGKVLEEERQDHGSLLTEQSHIRTQLRAVEVEIAAVEAGLETVQNAANKYNSVSANSEAENEVENHEFRDHNPSLAEGLVLQHALATDRLKSLKLKRGQLKEDLKAFEGEGKRQDPKECGLSLDLVVYEEETISKGTSQSVDKRQKKEKRNVCFQEDDEFDAALDAATSGLIETERDKLIRQGILTPFDQVRGFERRVQRTRPLRNSHHSVEIGAGNSMKDSISRIAASLSEIANARASTKLLDVEDVPKLDPPTRPFRRPKKFVDAKPSKEVGKSPKSQSSNLRKRKRPLPDKQWTEAASSEDEPWSDEDYREANASLTLRTNLERFMR